VYSELPKLFERAGRTRHGCITAIYTILQNPSIESDPLAEEIKSLLDGHIVMDQDLANEGTRPAIDPLASISRLSADLHPAELQTRLRKVVRLMARLRKDREIVLLGGTPDEELKQAIDLEPQIRALLHQEKDQKFTFEQSLQALELAEAH
ncbi:MAG: flagellum-specific ATP synthase FliI, partial [Proteobacteria bacterium]